MLSSHRIENNVQKNLMNQQNLSTYCIIAEREAILAQKISRRQYNDKAIGMQPIFNDQNDEQLTRSIEGNLSLMSLADLIQWIEGAKKSGTLIATSEDYTRRFFFQNGRLIFVWCDQEGDVLYEALRDQLGISMERITEALNRSEQLGISFVGLVSSEEGIPLERLSSLISTLAKKSLTSSLAWRTGRFRFSDVLPTSVLCSPINIKPTQVLLDSTVQIDEAHHMDQTNLDPVLNEVYDLIRKGALDIPPLPTEMQLLMEKINNPNLTIDQVVECLNDPLLVSKILRICNSPFYGRRGKVSTLRDAVVYMGLKSLMSIVTVNALSGFSPRHVDQIEQILHHSMMVGMVAKQLVRDMGGDHDQAFVCGLLHDFGWIVMLEMLSKYDLNQDKRDLLIHAHHETLGALVAQKWNFSEEIQEAIKHHHNPEQAKNHQNLVQIIHLADRLAKNEIPLPDEIIPTLTAKAADPAAPFADHLKELDQEINNILSLR
jgi:putative nucleotidyltransferase with HDIG domain